MKRFTVLGASIALMLFMVLPAGANSSDHIPRVGEQVDVLFNTVNEVEADTPFHIVHGWICEVGNEECTASQAVDSGFRLTIDGKLQHPIQLRAFEQGYWTQLMNLYQFRSGLPAGTYSIEACAFSPALEYCNESQLIVGGG